MKNIYLTLDYELFFGQFSGTQKKSIIEPTERLLKVLSHHNVKATFFVDSGYLIKLDEFRRKFPVLEDDYTDIITQLKWLDECGHDIQLHIHPHWEDCFFDGNKWVMDTHRYRIHDFNQQEIDDIVFRYKKVLSELKEKDVFAYRAGGWCIQPFDSIKSALMRNNIWLDSTVFKNGRGQSKTHYFDFKNIPNKSSWKFLNDPCVEDRNGFFTELPISSYKAPPIFFWRLAFFKKFGGNYHSSFGDGTAAGGSRWPLLRILFFSSNSVVSVDGFKSSFLAKAFDTLSSDINDFVIIGHPKAMSQYSLDQLESFLVSNRKHNFVSFSDYFIDQTCPACTANNR